MASWSDAPSPLPETLADRARRLERAGDLTAALEAYEAALARTPGEPDLLGGLARLALSLDMPEQALALWDQVAAAEPERLEAIDGRARALARLRRHGDAVEALRGAILARPHEARLWNALGVIVNETGDSEAAHSFFDEAVRLKPVYAGALYNRGDVRFDLGRLAEAEADFDAAVRHAVEPGEAAVIAFARALLQLHRGELATGWEGYEVRLAPDHPAAPAFEAPGARWSPTTPLQGAHLLVLGEQGLGDEIMFAGLLPEVLAEVGPSGQLSIAVEPRLVRLIQQSFPDVAVLPHATERLSGRAHRSVMLSKAGRPVDLWAPLASLPRRFRPTPASFPQRAYLQADPERVAHWRRRLGDGPVIGISWRSGLQAGRRSRHAPGLAAWVPLLARRDVRFVHLQYGAQDLELETLDGWAAAPLLRPEIDLRNDLDELAALCVALDLVISVPNATAALAAACGTETWFLTAPNAWTRLGTNGYPWYARARSFPAARFGEWAPVMRAVAEALAEVRSAN